MIEEELIKKSETNHRLVEQVADLEIEKAELNDKLTKAKRAFKKIEKIFYSGEDALKRLPKIYDVLVEVEQFLKEDN